MSRLGTGSPTKAGLVAAVALVSVVLELGLVGANFQDDCDITWEPPNAKMDERGNHLTLSLSATLQVYVCTSCRDDVFFIFQVSSVYCLLYSCNVSMSCVSDLCLLART